MKKLTFLLLMLTSLLTRAQLTLEHSYTNSNLSSGNKFILIEIAHQDFKYFIFNPNTNQFILYNLNHSVYTTVNVPLPVSVGSILVQFVSKSLFDCDSTTLEYGILQFDTVSTFSVYRENGTLFQKIDSCMFLNYSVGEQYATYSNTFPIINTPTGAKLILSKMSGEVDIYGLCGTFPSSIINNDNNGLYELYPYPNPSNNQIILPYNLTGGASVGTLIIYNESGYVIKEFSIDDNFREVVLTNNDLSSGTYFYSIKTKLGETKSKKFIMIK